MTQLFILKVLAATTAYFLLGVLWYSSLLFGPEWSKLVKKTGNKKSKIGAAAAHTVTFFGQLLSCLVMGILIVVLRILGAGDGAFFGMILGLAFVAMTMLSEAVYSGQPSKLYLINASYRVLGFALAGAIIAP